MYSIINDRIFWIYFIITLFFIILGMSSILISNDSYLIIISILWLLSNVALMILIYHASIRWGPLDSQICVIDANSRCFDPDNRIWLFVNILFIALLIISLLWAGELGNKNGELLRSMSGILILLGGLLLCALIINKSSDCLVTDGHIHSSTAFIYDIPFWVSVTYLIIWYSLTLYVVLTSG